MTNAIELKRGGVSLLLIVVAIVCFLLAAFGVGEKLGISIPWVGMAFFAAAFVF